MVAPHLITKILQCPELKLLDRALAASKFRGDLAQTLLRNEAPDNHPPLILWQHLDELVKHCSPFDMPFHADLLQAVGHNFLQPSDSVPAIRKQVSCNSEEPRDERQAAPLEPWKIGQSLA